MFIIVIPQKELNCFDFHQKSFKIKFQKIILQYFVKKKKSHTNFKMHENNHLFESILIRIEILKESNSFGFVNDHNFIKI